MARICLSRNVYEYELPMEYAVCCYWLGKHKGAIRVNDVIGANRRTPPDVASMAFDNRRLSEAALSGRRPPGFHR